MWCTVKSFTALQTRYLIAYDCNIRFCKHGAYSCRTIRLCTTSIRDNCRGTIIVNRNVQTHCHIQWQHSGPTIVTIELLFEGQNHTRGWYHGGWRPSSDDSLHSPTLIPSSALDKPSIMKRYHRRPTCSRTSRRRSPMMVTLHDTRFVECRWWNDGWTVKTVVTWRSSASMIPAPVCFNSYNSKLRSSDFEGVFVQLFIDHWGIVYIFLN